MIIEEKKLFKKFKKKLIEGYKYEPKDIVFEPKISVGKSKYIPDIVIYKDSNPYIVIELKTRYIHKVFENTYSKVFEYAKYLNAPYFAVASLEFIDAYKIEDGEVKSIDNIPSKDNSLLDKSSNKLEDKLVINLFEQIRDILKGGGKRDDYSIIKEVNKLLLLKWFIEKENINNFSKIESIEDGLKFMIELNDLLDFINHRFQVFDGKLSFNLNKQEFSKVFKILKTINLVDFYNIDKIYFESIIKKLKDEVLLSVDLIQFINSIILDKNNLLISNSGFGQLSLSFNQSAYSENNKTKLQTNSLLHLFKNNRLRSYWFDYLDEDLLIPEKYRNILTVPPINLRTNIYQNYKIENNKKNKLHSLLYIERSLQILEENGYLYVVVPSSILSNQSYEHARSFIKNNFKIITIASLPTGSLLNTNIACSLLVLQKTRFKNNYNILITEFNEENLNYIIKHMIEEFDYPNYINSDELQDRWDYHYFKEEFLKLEHKVNGLPHVLLGEMTSSIRGSNLGHDKNGTVHLITVSSIENGELNINKLSKVSENKNYENSRGIVYENDLVISVIGKFPRCAKVTKEFEGSNTNAGIVILRSESIENINYIYDYLNSSIGQLLLHRGITFTSTTPIVTQTELEKIPIILDFKYKGLENEIEYINTLPVFTYKKEDKTKIEHDECEEKIREKLIEQRKNFEEELDVKITEERNNYLSEFELNNDAEVSLIGLKGEVFGVNVIRCFLNVEILRRFETDKQDFQRDINSDHKQDLIKYISDENYKFFPEIVLGINNYFNINEDSSDGNTLIEENPISGSANLVKLSFLSDEVFNKIEVLDGRHRIESFKASEDIDLGVMVSVVFILFDSKQCENLLDKVIFYNLNKKARQLDPIDYLHLLKSDDKNNRLKELEILNVDLYKYLSSKKVEIYNESDSYKILEECIILTDYMEKVYEKNTKYLTDDKNKMVHINSFKYIKKHLLENNNYCVNLITKFYKLIIHIVSKEENRENMHEFLLKEITGFVEWLRLSKLMENIDEIQDFKDFYSTYQKTNIPKSRKIYLSMPYHKETEWTYFVIKDVINEISNNLQIKIDLIRTDQQTYGVHTGISETIYNEIESCDLMIADLTGDNVNVFNEVGFKMGIDKAQKLSETQIIFLVNSKCYYEERLENSSFIDNEYEVRGKILKNKSKDVPFNLRGIKHIEFHTSHYLKAELYKELEQYFNYYKISKVSK